MNARHLASLGKVHGNIASDVWPDGAILSCQKCRYSQRITTAQAGDYLAHGWPKHCGATMGCEAAAPLSPPPTGLPHSET